MAAACTEQAEEFLDPTGKRFAIDAVVRGPHVPDTQKPGCLWCGDLRNGAVHTFIWSGDESATTYFVLDSDKHRPLINAYLNCFGSDSFSLNVDTLNADLRRLKPFFDDCGGDDQDSLRDRADEQSDESEHDDGDDDMSRAMYRWLSEMPEWYRNEVLPSLMSSLNGSEFRGFRVIRVNAKFGDMFVIPSCTYLWSAGWTHTHDECPEIHEHYVCPDGSNWSKTAAWAKLSAEQLALLRRHGLLYCGNFVALANSYNPRDPTYHPHNPPESCEWMAKSDVGWHHLEAYKHVKSKEFEAAFVGGGDEDKRRIYYVMVAAVRKAVVEFHMTPFLRVLGYVPYGISSRSKRRRLTVDG